MGEVVEKLEGECDADMQFVQLNVQLDVQLNVQLIALSIMHRTVWKIFMA